MNKELKEKGYCYIPKFISTIEADNLAQEFFIAQRDGKLVLDPQCPASPAAYNLLPCVKVLIKKIPHVSELCGEDVLPTYTYGRIYTHGEVLHKHRDRAACEISLTVNLQKDETDWPIWVKKPNGEDISVNLNVGDAMMYLGCEVEHWRNPYQGHTHVQFFMHYVAANGPNAHAFFDKERRQ